jgi:hypothetical protein
MLAKIRRDKASNRLILGFYHVYLQKLRVASRLVERWRHQPVQTGRRPLSNTAWPSRW